jgi:hypothetical protein
LSGMGQVLSFCDARTERVRARLCALADSRMPGIVETRSGAIDAHRIFCREQWVVLIDRYGVQTRLAYDEISDVGPVLPASEIIRLAGWQVVEQVNLAQQPEPTKVLRFPSGRSG